MSEELKPCPFCGGSVHQQGVDNVIKCDACGVTICIPMSNKQEEAFEQGLVFDNWDIAHVAEFWNTRAERTCRMVPMWEEPDANGYMTCECDVCGWMADYAADGKRTGWCASCGAKVVG